MSVIFRHESNFAVSVIDQSMLAYSKFVSVSANVFDDLLGTKEGAFAVHHPKLRSLFFKMQFLYCNLVRLNN